MRTQLESAKRGLGAARAQLKTTKAELARQVDDLHRLHDLGMRLSSHVELSTLLDEVLAAVCALQGARLGLLLLFDTERRELRPVATVGVTPAQVKELIDAAGIVGASGLAVAERRAVLIKDLQRERGFGIDAPSAAAARCRALSCFPLQARTGQILGAIVTCFAKPRTPAAREIELVQLYGAQASEFIENARAYESLREANRLKDEFLATLSHEIRTPLNAVLGWTRVLRLTGSTPGDAQKHRALEAIERNSRIQAQLVDDLLDVSSIVTGRMRLSFEPVNLAVVVERAVETVRPTADAKSLTLVTESPSDVVVFGDAARLQQVVWNLLVNAVRVTPENGEIKVTLNARDSSVWIVVSDTGIGISPTFIPHVFDRFRQAEGGVVGSHRGLGLGLAIVRHVVEAHGGTVRAESPGVGHGATFTVTLPLGTMAVPERAAVEAPVGAPSLGGVRILVVEDDADARELLATVLRTYGASVTSVPTGVAALATLNETVQDLLIADIGMADMNGYALIRTIRAVSDKTGRRLPAIALTVYATSKERDDALAAGFDRHIVKPIDPERVANTVQELLQMTKPRALDE